MSRSAWLEITDRGARAAGGFAVQLRWQIQEQAGSAELVLSAPFTSATARASQRYIEGFRSWRREDRDEAQTAEHMLLTLGRALGNALVDSGYRLLTFCESIERAGLSELRVVVRSEQLERLELPWELLILPDSPYTLAAAAGAFVRTLPGATPIEAPPRTLDLGNASQGRSLRYLRVDTTDCQRPLAQRVSMSWTQHSWLGALDHRLAPSARCPDPLTDAACGEYHVVHYCGSIFTDYTEPRLKVSLDARDADMSASAFVARARELGAQLLILEPDNSGVVADEIALMALRAGIENVLIVAQGSQRGWPSAWLNHLLATLRAGVGLQRAIVETRKRLQSAFLEARQVQAEHIHAAQQWHVLRHYSTRDVVFFEQAAVLQPFESTEGYSLLRRRLFGFDSGFLLPSAPDLGDAGTLCISRALWERRLLLVDAPHGGGLTHALHRSALLACANRDVVRAYYWDFARERYTTSDILEMVAGARGETEREAVTEQSVLSAMPEGGELYVFDNLEVLADPGATAQGHPGVESVLALAGRLAEAGALCIVGSHAVLSPFTLPSSRLTLPPLTEQEAVALLAHDKPALSLDATRLSIMENLQGNPLLLRRVLAPAAEGTERALLEEVRARYGASVGCRLQVAHFHEARFAELEPYWQQLLLAWLPCGSLFLQLLMLAVDRPGGEKSELGRALWASLGAPEGETCAGALARLQAAGFAVAQGGGICIDGAARAYLQAQGAPAQAQQLASLLPRLLCESISRILERGGSGQIDFLINHLLSHRGLVLQHLQATMRAGDYGLATRTFLRFHALLLRTPLAVEAGPAALQLLDSAGPDMCNIEDPVRATAWLTIALRADLQPASAAVASGRDYWSELLVRGSLGSHAHGPGLFPLVVAFLERAYEQARDLSAYRVVAQVATAHYRQSGQTTALIGQLRALATAEHALGNAAARDAIEHELLHELAYGEHAGAAELRRHTLVHVGTMRLRRADHDGVSEVIELLERAQPSGASSSSILMLRGELALQRAQPMLACECFCQLWSAAMSGKRDIDVDNVARRLKQLEATLGADQFASAYGRYAGDALTPEALGMSFQTVTQIAPASSC